MDQTQVNPSLRQLDYIGYLRGIAALVVALGHMVGMVPPNHPRYSFLNADGYHRIIWPTLFGYEMVCLFMMLSGFALFYAEYQRRIRGFGASAFRIYLRRRAWRIIPTYYSAILASGVILFLIASFSVKPSSSLDTSRPVTWSGVLSHLFFIHNLNPIWSNQINPPLWTMALEVQNYLLLPLVLLLSKKTLSPLVAILAIGFSSRVLQHLLHAPIFGLSDFFLLGVFIAYAVLTYKTVQWALFKYIFYIFLIIGALRLPQFSSKLLYESIWLIAFSSLLVWRYSCPNVPQNLARRLLRWLGERSYSLYVIHFPISLAIWAIVARLCKNHDLQSLLMVIIALPIALFIADRFYRWIELPSLMRSKQIGRTGTL